MPKVLHDIAPPRVRKAGCRIVGKTRSLAARFRRALSTLLHVQKRLFFVHFRIEVLIAFVVIAALAAFHDSLFTRATVTRLHPASCVGTFRNPENASGAPDIAADGFAGDFNEDNSAVSRGSAVVECGEYGRPEREFTGAKLTFVLGIKRTAPAPKSLPLASDEPETPSPVPSEGTSGLTITPSATVVPVPSDVLTPSPATSESSIPMASDIPTSSPSVSESLTPSPSPSETIEPQADPILPTAADSQAPDASGGETEGAAKCQKTQESLARRTFRVLASIVLPVYAEELFAVVPTTSNDIEPTATDSLAPDASGQTPSATDALSPSLSVSDAQTPFPTASDVLTPSPSLVGSDPQSPSPTASDALTPSPSASEQAGGNAVPLNLIVPNLDAGDVQAPSPSGSPSQDPDFEFVDFVVRLQYAAGSERWTTLEELTKAHATVLQESPSPVLPSSSEHIPAGPDASVERALPVVEDATQAPAAAPDGQEAPSPSAEAPSATPSQEPEISQTPSQEPPVSPSESPSETQAPSPVSIIPVPGGRSAPSNRICLTAGWAVATAAYSYAIRDETGREILAYHWHPEQRVQFPHLHLGPGTLPGSSRLQKLHLPTGYVSLPDVIELVITQLRVRVRRSDWREVLENTRRTDVHRGKPALTGSQ